VLLAVLAPVLARLLYFACSRRREYLADAGAAQFTRYPEGLASALEKISAPGAQERSASRVLAPMYIVNPLRPGGSARSLFSTHPAAEDRIRILRGMAGNAALASYERSYRSLHGSRGLRGLGAAAGPEVVPARDALEEAPATDAVLRWRGAREIHHALDSLAAISCACGIRLKLPPGFDRPSIVCPRCGANLELQAGG
jgi:heat shock protein HtpX